MSEDSAKDREQSAPDPRKREALKKLGRYAAYTAPATLVAVGYTAARAPLARRQPAAAIAAAQPTAVAAAQPTAVAEPAGLRAASQPTARIAGSKPKGTKRCPTIAPTTGNRARRIRENARP